MTPFGLQSDGISWSAVTPPAAETRAIAGEELWWPPPNAAGVTVNERTALHLSPFLTGVSVVSTDVGVIPLDVYQRQERGRRAATEHPLTRLLTRTPNGETTPVKWRSALMGHALEYGNGYAEVQRKGRGTPYALHLLDPETTKARRNAGGQLGYQVAGGKWIPAADVLHVAGFGLDGVSGLNLVDLLREAIGVGLAAQSYSADYFANGAEPGGVIETAKKLGKTGRENLAAGWQMKHGTPGNRHKVAVLEDGAQWKGTATDPDKAQLIDARRFQALDTNRPLRVPPHKYGDFSQAHDASVESSNLDYLISTLMGWLVQIEQEFNLKLFSEAEWGKGYYCEHNVDALLRGDIKTRYEAYGMALRDGWKNRDEVRHSENLNPMPEGQNGDLYTVQAQVVPLAQAGVAFAPKAPATPPTQDPATDATA